MRCYKCSKKLKLSFALTGSGQCDNCLKEQKIKTKYTVITTLIVFMLFASPLNFIVSSFLTLLIGFGYLTYAETEATEHE